MHFNILSFVGVWFQSHGLKTQFLQYCINDLLYEVTHFTHYMYIYCVRYSFALHYSQNHSLNLYWKNGGSLHWSGLQLNLIRVKGQRMALRTRDGWRIDSAVWTNRTGWKKMQRQHKMGSRARGMDEDDLLWKETGTFKELKGETDVRCTEKSTANEEWSLLFFHFGVQNECSCGLITGKRTCERTFTSAGQVQVKCLQPPGLNSSLTKTTQTSEQETT